MATPIIRKKAASIKTATRKKLTSTHLIVTISVQGSGATVSRLMFERILTLSDQALSRIWHILLVLSFLDLIFSSVLTSFAHWQAVLAADWCTGYTYLAELSILPVMRHAPLPQAFALG